MEVNDILSRLNDLSISHEDKLNHIHNLDKMSTFEALKSSGKLFFVKCEFLDNILSISLVRRPKYQP